MNQYVSQLQYSQSSILRLIHTSFNDHGIRNRKRTDKQIILYKIFTGNKSVNSRDEVVTGASSNCDTMDIPLTSPMICQSKDADRWNLSNPQDSIR